MGLATLVLATLPPLPTLDMLPPPCSLDASGSVRLRLSPRPTPPTSPQVTGLATPPSALAMPALATLVLATLPPLPTLDMLPPPCSLDASGSVRPRLRLRLTPPTWLPATDLATLVSV